MSGARPSHVCSTVIAVILDTTRADKAEPKFRVLGYGYAFCSLNTRTDDHSTPMHIITLELEGDPYGREIRPAGVDQRFRGIARRAILAPKVDFITG